MINTLLKRLFSHIDAFLMGFILLGMLVGLLVLYSASGQSLDRVFAQMVNMSLALVVMWVVANIAPQILERIALPLYVLGILLLLGVFLFGEISHGARRWLDLGIITIQPSELMRIAMPMLLAWFFSKREAGVRFSDYAIAAILLLIPVGLIMKQPDLGTSLLITASGFYVLFLAGLSIRLLAGLGIVLAAAALYSGHICMIISNAASKFSSIHRRIHSARVITPFRQPLRWVRAVWLAKAGCRAHNHSWTFCRNVLRTLFLQCLVKNSVCWGTCCCYCCSQLLLDAGW